MKYLIAAALLVFTFLAPGISQVKQVCGTIDQTEILERLKENKRALKANPQLRNGEVVFVQFNFMLLPKQMEVEELMKKKSFNNFVVSMKTMML